MFDEHKEYVLDRIDSMLRLLQKRESDPESQQAMAALRVFRLRIQCSSSEEWSAPEEDLEMNFYSLLESQRILALTFLDAMEADVAELTGDSTLSTNSDD